MKLIFTAIIAMFSTFAQADVIAGYVCLYERTDRSFSVVATSPREDDYTQIYAFNSCADATHNCTIKCKEAAIQRRADGRWVRVSNKASSMYPGCSERDIRNRDCLNRSGEGIPRIN